MESLVGELASTIAWGTTTVVSTTANKVASITGLDEVFTMAGKGGGDFIFSIPEARNLAEGGGSVYATVYVGEVP